LQVHIKAGKRTMGVAARFEFELAPNFFEQGRDTFARGASSIRVQACYPAVLGETENHPALAPRVRDTQGLSGRSPRKSRWRGGGQGAGGGGDGGLGGGGGPRVRVRRMRGVVPTPSYPSCCGGLLCGYSDPVFERKLDRHMKTNSFGSAAWLLPWPPRIGSPRLCTNPSPRPSPVRRPRARQVRA